MPARTPAPAPAPAHNAAAQRASADEDLVKWQGGRGGRRDAVPAAVLLLMRMLSCGPLPVIIRLCPPVSCALPVSCASSSLPQDVPRGGDMRVAGRILLPESLTRANQALGIPRLAEGPFETHVRGQNFHLFFCSLYSCAKHAETWALPARCGRAGLLRCPVRCRQLEVGLAATSSQPKSSIVLVICEPR